MFWASPFKKPGYRLGFKLHVMRVIACEKIVPSIVKTKVSNSSFARKHIYLTFKYYGLILSSLNFRPVRLKDNREDNRKISGKTWHTRTKFYSTVYWNKRPLFPKGTFSSMELLMFWQSSFSAACTCSILHQKWNRIQCFPHLSVSSKWLNCLVRRQCHVNPHAFHGKYILTYSEALTKLLNASSLDKSILSIIACPHLSRQKQTDKNTSKINWGWILPFYCLKFTYKFW